MPAARDQLDGSATASPEWRRPEPRRLDDLRLSWCSACRAAHQHDSPCVLDALRGAVGWAHGGRAYGAGE
jgi:hypothetical protein